MFLALKLGTSFSIAGGRAIFLDTVADRYVCLAPDLDALFQAILQLRRPIAAQETPERLLASGLFELQPAARAIKPFVQRDEPKGDFTHDGQRSLIAHLPVGIAMLAITSIALRYRGFHAVMEGPHIDNSWDVSPHLGAIISAHRLLGLGTRAHQTCLVRSVALKRHLARHALGSRLVLGVQARPFKAHCWLQHEHMILNDTLETVRDFVPLFEV